MIISWTDLRGTGTGSGFDVYAQKVVDGVPSWTPNGVPVSTAAQHQVSPHTATAGDGAFVVWLDQRVPPHTDVYAQRFDLNGNPQWAVDGIPLESDASGIVDVVPDGASGFLMAWTAGNDLRAQRVDHDGTRLWQPGGVPVRTGTGFTSAARMMWNGAALILAWADNRSGTSYDLYAGQVPASGITGVPLPERLSAGLPARLLSSNPHERGDVRLAVDLSEAAPLAVDVFDPRGRWVWRLPSEQREAGAHVLRWNGRDPSGERPPAGVYFLRATAGARSGTVKLLLLR